MGSYVSREDFEELETSMSRNRNTAKNFLLLFCFIVVLQLLSYALMNVGR